MKFRSKKRSMEFDLARSKKEASFRTFEEVEDE